MANSELVNEFYSALSRNDISAAVKLFDPKIERVEFEGSAMAGTFRGLTEMEAHLIKGRSTWAEGSCTPHELIKAGDKLIAHVHVKVRLKDKIDWIDAFTADVFTFNHGKISGMRSFFNLEETREWVRIKSS